MKIEGIYAKNIELTPAIERRVTSRLQKIAKIVKRLEPASIKAEVGMVSPHHQKGDDLFYAELHATIQGQEFHASKNEADLYKAIEKVRDDFYRQVVAWKERTIGRERKGRALFKRLLRRDTEV
ncbi:ribosome-associated translation inhibitor RaiA [Candidatus Uhrbacteria bacterium]|nr:ribosome-associated translation inhibitor RaiA [Candidatus Uhrbacteria bacterium]